MTVPLLHGPELKVLETQPKAVNLFDLTAIDKEIASQRVISTKEKAAWIALLLVLSMIVLTALVLLLAEAVGLHWAICTRPHHFLLKVWPWAKPDRDTWPYDLYWKSLTLAEKRQEMFRVTYGEVDLYDMYEDLAHKTHHNVDDIHEDIVN